MRRFEAYIINSLHTFRAAARGRYSYESDSVRQIRESVMATQSDADNLRADRMNVGRDVRVSFNKITKP